MMAAVPLAHTARNGGARIGLGGLLLHILGKVLL